MQKYDKRSIVKKIKPTKYPSQVFLIFNHIILDRRLPTLLWNDT